MELSSLKKKLASAQRGHKLLKDKRDELMRQFMNMIKENKQLRSEVEQLTPTSPTTVRIVRSFFSERKRKKTKILKLPPSPRKQTTRILPIRL